MLPPGLARHAEGLYELADETFRPEKPVQQRLIKLLRERGPLRTGQMRAAFGPLEWEREAERLVRSGILRRRSILPPPSVRPKKIRMVQLAVSRREADAVIASLQSDSISAARKAAAQRRARVLEAILGEGKPLAVEWVYASSNAKLEDVKWLAEAGWVDLVYEEMMRDPLSGRSFTAAEPPPLTGEQEAALRLMAAALEQHRAERFLLFGITGSGKTEVYLRAAAETVGARPPGDRAGPGDRADTADGPAVRIALPGPARTGAQHALPGRTLRRLAAGPRREPGCGARTAQRALFAAAEYRIDRSG